MSTITASFTAVGDVSTGLLVADGQSATCGASGTYAATIVLERTNDGGQTWETVLTSAVANATVSQVVSVPGTYRWRCSDYTSGTVAISSSNDAVTLFGPIVNAAGEVVFEVTSDGPVTDGTPSGFGTALDGLTNADATVLGTGAAPLMVAAAPGIAQRNLVMGAAAAASLVDGSKNTILGDGASSGGASNSSVIAIGAGAGSGAAANTLAIGSADSKVEVIDIVPKFAALGPKMLNPLTLAANLYGHAPASVDDNNMLASSFSFYLDELGNALKVRVHYADGTTFKDGTIALL